MDTRLSKYITFRMTSPKNGDLCHSSLVSCGTISSERIAPPRGADRGFAHEKAARFFQFGYVQSHVRVINARLLMYLLAVRWSRIGTHRYQER